MKAAARRGVLIAGAVAVTVAVAWAALRQPGGDKLIVSRDFTGFDTHITLTARAPAAYAREANDRTLASAQALVQQLDHIWSVNGDGELAKINQALERGEAADIPPALSPIFEVSSRAWRSSEGAFDPRYGRLVRLWGFADEMARRTRPPDDSEIARLAQALRDAPPLNPQKFGPADVQLDFTGIVKGHAADLAIAYLYKNGVTDAIVDLGGTIKASGRRGDHPWKIGIGNPRPGSPNALLTTLELQNPEAVATRSDSEKFFEFAGHRYHHIIDPRDGSPAQGLRSVTVVGANAAWAEAASSALMAAGPDHWRAMARALGSEQVLVVDGNGTLLVTAALAPRLHLAEGVQATTVP